MSRSKLPSLTRTVVVTVLGLGSVSLLLSVWCLPSLAEDGQRTSGSFATPPLEAATSSVVRQLVATESFVERRFRPVTFRRIAQEGKAKEPGPSELRSLEDPSKISTDAAESLSGRSKQLEPGAVPLVDNSFKNKQDKGGELSIEHSDKVSPSREKSEVDLSESGRSTRFPSVDERVRVYMTNWYLPPCQTHGDAVVEYNFRQEDHGTEWMIFREVRTEREKKRGVLRTFVVDDTTGFDLLRHLNAQHMLDCKSSYCTDLVKYMFPAIERASNSTQKLSDTFLSSLVLYQFSDVEKTRAFNTAASRPGPYPNVPHLKKFRFSLSKAERDRMTNSAAGCAPSPRPIPITIVQQQQQQREGVIKILPVSQPVIFKLKMQRHYGYVAAIPEKDKPWSDKKNQAIFRGQFTGRFPSGMSTGAIKQLPVVQQCQLLHRCRLVFNSAKNSTLVDAKLALPVLDVRRDFPQTIDSVDLYGERVSIEDMLSYKAIIMLEGNDVSSGLKWALYSNSVVLTQTPTKTSWAMEELLVPWVHYIPLADDLSDVDEKMQWVIDNDKEAEKIALRGKLWISDLIYHPDAETDEQLVFDEILRRYMMHFVRNPSLQMPASVVQ